MKLIQLLRQPLVHFLLIGVVIFGFFAAVDETPSVSSVREIVVTKDMVEQLAARFKSVHRRRPTSQELSGLVDNLIKEEVLVREATALSLDRNDTVIRRRLRQKMEFLTSSAVAALKPTDDQLRAYFKANAKQYTAPARIAFEQVYLGEAPAKDVIDQARSALKSGNYTPPDGVKKLLLLPASVPLSSQMAVDKVFGREFFKRLGDIDVGNWSKPVQSGYGIHLVRISKRVPASVIPFDAVRGGVQRDWLSAKAKEMAEGQYARMLARYQVNRPDLSAIKVYRP